MRLSETERKAIKAALKKHFDATARVYLFGSRTDDQKRGGDIDLYIEQDTIMIKQAPRTIESALKENESLRPEKSC